MQKAFHCPHCDKKYPVLPTLVGRKVRCTACKNVFQLQYDGIALKVDVTVATTGGTAAATGIAVGQQENAALESKKPSAAGIESPSVQNLSGMRQAVGGRQQTKAIRRKTERIKRIRSSLQGAAEEALSNVHDDENATQDGSASRGSRKKSVEIVLTGSGSKPRSPLWPIGVIIFLCIGGLLWFVNLAPSPEVGALLHYAAPVAVDEAHYPGRMNMYRSRMWLYSRDGQTLPPVLLNVDSASVEFVMRVDWMMVSSVSATVLDGMTLSRRFGIWHKPLPASAKGEPQSLDQLWEAHLLKGTVAGFYKELTAQRIEYVHAMELPRILAEKGLSKEELYIASLFLAGTTDALGRTRTDLGLYGGAGPRVAQVFEFNGPESHMLIDAHGHYTYASGSAFSGLIVGFEGMEHGGEPAQGWRVLDMRLGDSMAAYYTQKQNPLMHLSATAHAQLGVELASAVQAARP